MIEYRLEHIDTTASFNSLVTAEKSQTGKKKKKKSKELMRTSFTQRTFPWRIQTIYFCKVYISWQNESLQKKKKQPQN